MTLKKQKIENRQIDTDYRLINGLPIPSNPNYYLTKISGFDPTKQQVLSNNQGVLKWFEASSFLYEGLCFKATQASRIGYAIKGTLNNIQIQYHLESGDWIDWDGSFIDLNAGERMWVRNNRNTLSLSTSNYFYFKMEGSVASSGDVSSMINFTDITEYCYYSLFKDCTVLTLPPNLPAITLAHSCYRTMFANCSGLVKTPDLPAINLAQECYEWMFQNCTSLIATSSLPSPNLKLGCYKGMFYSCTSLTIAPALPATTAIEVCYSYMFYGCTSLVTPPVLPATTLEHDCYAHMFDSCTNLASAPNLPATMVDYCYPSMFYGCTKLKISNTGGTGKTKFFTCPATIPSGAVTYMFARTGGTYTNDPVANGEYYWY